MFIERAAEINALKSNFGMIVPSSVACTDKYIPVQEIFLSMGSLHISSYSDQRGKLFDIPHPRLSIVLCSKEFNHKQEVQTTTYQKLGFRKNLFQTIAYNNVRSSINSGRIPRFCCELEMSMWEKIHKHLNVSTYTNQSKYKVYYSRKIGWFLQATDFRPKIYDGNGNLRRPSELKAVKFDKKDLATRYFVVLNSNLFYWFVTVGSDCRNLNKRETDGFPISLDAHSLIKLSTIGTDLSTGLINNSVYKKMTYRNANPPQNKLKIQCIYPKKSKLIIDKIDTLLAKHYNFTDEELDYIINYDIKYRMGLGNG